MTDKGEKSMAEPKKAPPLRIELDLSEYQVGEDGSTLFDQVLDMAARQLVNRLRDDSKDRLYSTLTARAVEIRDEIIRQAIRPDIEEALVGAVQPTDAFGNPKGEPVTLHETIVQAARKYLTEEKTERFNGPRMTVVQQFIHEAVKGVVTKELTAALNEAKAEVREAVKAKGAEIITETITRMAKS